MTITLWQNHPKSGAMTVPKFHFINQELSPCDNYRPVTTFWPCPEVVTISDKHCTNRSEDMTWYVMFMLCRYRLFFTGTQRQRESRQERDAVGYCKARPTSEMSRCGIRWWRRMCHNNGVRRAHVCPSCAYHQLSHIQVSRAGSVSSDAGA